jgi:hypothetical protein
MDGPGWIGAKIAHSRGSDIGFFRTGTAAASTAGGFISDADRFTASFDQNGKFTKAYFEGASFSGEGVMVKAGSPLTASIAIKDANTELELQSVAGNTVTVAVPGKPVSVQLNGKSVSSWTYDAGTRSVSMKIGAGKSEINILSGK